MIARIDASGVPVGTVAVLMLSVFTVSMGFGIVLPVLPFLLERLLGTGGDATQVSRATGLLTGFYMLSLLHFAPVGGRLSDRYSVKLVGLHRGHSSSFCSSRQR